MVLSSKFFTPFKRNVSNDLVKSHQLMNKCALITRSGLGLFTWLPLGYRVLHKIERIVSRFHDKLSFNKCCAPILQPTELWNESNRYNAYGPETMRVHDRHGKELILGPTAEEMFVDAARQHVTSYKELPINLYNIQWKFRDEIRPRFGVIRSREFLMCDGYSFHLDEESAQEFYEEALLGYQEMFEALGFDCEPILQTDTGEIGGKISHEFFTVEDKSNEHNERIELGHIFLFGTKYSESMKFSVDYKGEKLFPFMGSYGVGVSRLVASYAEIFGHDHGVSWPEQVAPFYITLLGANEPQSLDICAKIHEIWPDEIYYEDKDISFGEKNVIAKLVGSPYVITAGKQELKNGYVKLNDEEIAVDEIVDKVKSLKAAVRGGV